MDKHAVKKLLVQACCGPCACAVLPSGTLFFNGDNFDSQQEYEHRLEALKTVDREFYDGNAVVEPYSPREFNTCEDCIRYRLKRCAAHAKKTGCDCFTTTLTVSPHKDTETVNIIGREVGQEYGVEFLELNLKKNNGFAKSVEISKRLGLYRQNYCGCKKSMRQ